MKIDGVVSGFKNINAGVPQGSKIGPFVFIAKINKLPDIATTDKYSGKEHVSIFMDDTTLSEILDMNNCESQSTSNLQANVERISRFSKEDKMKLNLKKTKEMVIDFRKNKNPDILAITIDNIVIERKISYKLLGIVIESDFKWHKNTCLIVKKKESDLCWNMVTYCGMGD